LKNDWELKMTSKIETLEDLSLSVEQDENAFIDKKDIEARRKKEELERIRKRRYHQLQQEYSEGEFTTIQVLFIETQAACLVAQRCGGPKVSLKDQKPLVIERIKELFSEEDSDILLDRFPSLRTVEGWAHKKQWKSAVLDKMKTNEVFSTGNVFDVYQNLYRQAAEGKNAKFIELYMELAGEKSKQNEKKDSFMDKLESLKGALHDGDS